MTTETLYLRCHFFVVGTRPLCLWDTSISDKNLKFLNSIDPSYFEYLGQLYSDSLNTQDQSTSRKAQHAALALRTAYAQALETLFALICSAIQAPWCVPAWVNAYKNHELRDLVEKIQETQQIISLLETETPSWSTVYDFLFPALDIEDEIYKSAVRDGFIRTWKRFAYDFLDDGSIREYNSIKHGLRISSGGFKLHIGIPEEPGVPPPTDKMVEVTSSDFGSSYLNFEKVGDQAHHLCLKGELRNWNLESLVWGLQLAAMSIANVQSVLKGQSENNSQAPFRCPGDLLDFDRWRGFVTLTEPEIAIPSELIHPFTKEDILSNYKAGIYSQSRNILLREGNNG
ncbi:hypothetical protein [Leptolyngbya sp. NIES-2104]|uniref:hypothetical protein n=1 Tax=Leptolyngbya sp. NIES-2104 TaxID=1552121 RepID=UPI0006EC453D|nr:hypothetical protein [Leptolyngbya sp. NIES-2104]GAQ00200.1 hypothetical protein NIES2104_67650 [Leptolyngbya sp. NIES-2104]